MNTAVPTLAGSRASRLDTQREPAGKLAGRDTAQLRVRLAALRPERQQLRRDRRRDLLELHAGTRRRREPCPRGRDRDQQPRIDDRLHRAERRGRLDTTADQHRDPNHQRHRRGRPDAECEHRAHGPVRPRSSSPTSGHAATRKAATTRSRWPPSRPTRPPRPTSATRSMCR